MRVKSLICLMTLLLALALAVPAVFAAEKPNILVIWGDDIGFWNVSHNNRGMMGYQTPNIDRIANEGLSFTDYYAEQSCTAGIAASRLFAALAAEQPINRDKKGDTQC